jgi:WD40 repeat protein
MNVYQNYAHTVETIDVLESDTVILLRDCHWVVQKYCTNLETHTLQVYYSLELWMPQCPLLQYAQNHSLSDGPHLISKTVTLWTSNTIVIEGNVGSMLAVVFSPNDTHIALGLSHKTVWLWYTQMGHQFAPLETKSVVTSMAISQHSHNVQVQLFTDAHR